ncbi:restriction endonuclease subunit S [Nitrosomonas aestuarii]|uniref:restriction endonuclease subunit S n=1 Tax=Nitrosomonas aestuarii TaxID=52441 RepID=UPI000D31076C|nr:restriction endonuclease subunit S [Nitrosomonas aestuarii]PTN11829.1 type I restriction enzyme S subunit [Nitrosomonas aestuarii]
MGRYQNYSGYRSTLVEWIGDIPEHWNLIRGKFKFTNKKVVNKELQCMERLALTMNGVIERSIESDEGLQPAEFSGYQIFEKGDLVFKLIDLENFKTSRVGIVPKKGIMSPAYIRATPNEKVNTRFFYYFYFDLYLRGIYNDIGGQGVRSALYASDLLELLICTPTVDEQEQIANFLDHETAKIDTLIEKQQQLIKLLKEKRQTVISHAVTKGLNPNAPMRDSGVEWLGEVPKHWIVGKVAYCSSSLDQCRVPIEAGVRGDRQGEYPYYGTSGIIDYVDDYLFDEPLVLVCEDGWNLMLRSQPVARPVNGKIWVNNHAHILRADVVEPSLLAECIEQTPLHLFVTGMRQPKLTADALRNIPVAYPPEKDEQMQLVQYMGKVVSKFSLLESRAKDSIELLKERRTALIFAAVTGKIDVRNWKAPEQSSTNQEAVA